MRSAQHSAASSCCPRSRSPPAPPSSRPQISYDDATAEPACSSGEADRQARAGRGDAEAAAASGPAQAVARRNGSRPEPRDPDRSRRPRPTPPHGCSRTRNGYINAVQVYPFAKGALYQVYAAPGQVTDIALQEGEQLVGSGPVAAGDTVRWIIGDTESGTGPPKRVHILVKPTRPDLITNLVINTDRRTYHLELRSTEKTYMASVSWQYPQDQLIALRRQNAVAEAAAPVATGARHRHAQFPLRDRRRHARLAAAARLR